MLEGRGGMGLLLLNGVHLVMDLGLFGYPFSFSLVLHCLLRIGHPKWAMSLTSYAFHSSS